jgi:hypothetical protein
MEAVPHDTQGNFALRGLCPYAECGRPSLFVRIQSTNVGVSPDARPGQTVFRWVAVLQCQACKRYVLGLVDQPQSTISYTYREHYPRGSPDDRVAEEIPDHIMSDFKEALRCLWIDAYNATAEMCRRALEASCLDLGAPKNKKLEKMIDWLEEQRKITPYLKEAAHNVRLGGNRAAHPPADGPTPSALTSTQDESQPSGPVAKIEKDHAEAIVGFTREFFHHVYVGPSLLSKYDFSKPKSKMP